MVFKNREIAGMILVSFAWLILAGILFSVTGISPFLLLVFLWLFVVGTFLVFTVVRYRKIHELTEYLSLLQTRMQHLDIRDNIEGELSVLKNEIYKLSEKLLSQAEQLKEDKLFLARALSDISHQLKTPLTSMMMMSEFLSDENLPKEKRREFLQGIESGLARMEWLVLSLLKLSRLDADAVEMTRAPLDVYELLLLAVAPLRAMYQAKGVTLEIALTEEPITLYGDENWLSEALSNLLKNCMEHTMAGGKVSVTYGGNNLYTEIEITDTGEGIAPEDLPHIFERFYRGKNADSQSVGIGLALSKEIIHHLRGRIQVESTPGAGTKFLIRMYR